MPGFTKYVTSAISNMNLSNRDHKASGNTLTDTYFKVAIIQEPYVQGIIDISTS